MIFCAGGEARVVVRRESFEDLAARDQDAPPRPGDRLRRPHPFKVGLLGHGTVGGAFATLLDERAGEIERFNGRAPGDHGRADTLARELRGDPRRART